MKQSQETILINQCINKALEELDELGLEEIEPIPELNEALGINEQGFDWLEV